MAKATSSTLNYGEGFNNGDWVISGKLGYANKSVAGVSGSELAVLPSVGYFLKDNLALVGTLGIENTSGGGTSSNTLVVGAAVRLYMTPGSKFSLFGQGGILFKKPENTSEFEISVKPGFNYFVAKNFSIESTFGSIGIVNTSAGGTSNTDFNFGINMSEIGLGLNYRF